MGFAPFSALCHPTIALHKNFTIDSCNRQIHYVKPDQPRPVPGSPVTFRATPPTPHHSRAGDAAPALESKPNCVIFLDVRSRAKLCCGKSVSPQAPWGPCDARLSFYPLCIPASDKMGRRAQPVSSEDWPFDVCLSRPTSVPQIQPGIEISFPDDPITIYESGAYFSLLAQ